MYDQTSLPPPTPFCVVLFFKSIVVEYDSVLSFAFFQCLRRFLLIVLVKKTAKRTVSRILCGTKCVIIQESDGMSLLEAYNCAMVFHAIYSHAGKTVYTVLLLSNIFE